MSEPVTSVSEWERQRREATYSHVKAVKQLRRELDDSIQKAKALLQWSGSQETMQAVVKLQEGVMWLGMELKRVGEENPGLVKNPYPNSKDPSNTTIDPTAEGMRL